MNPNGGAKATMPRARLPPPSKIPASAVEMPGESLANLDVQFGGLDLQFGASNEASSGGSAGSIIFFYFEIFFLYQISLKRMC